MALLLVVALGLLASAHAGNTGMMDMMHANSNMQMVPMNNNGCNQGADGSIPAGCAIPDMGMDNMEEYLERQMEQQQFETQAMAEKIKAQFEAMVSSVNMKKQRYAMSLVTEFVSACECARSSSQIYSAVFLSQARQLNMTDLINPYDNSKLPYEAKSEEEARHLIFGGLITKMCESMATYMTFADQVTQRVPAFQGKK